MSQRNKIIPAVFLILNTKGTVLLLERFNTGWNDGKLTLPSGHVEKGESPKKAMVREAYEEVGIRVKERDLVLRNVLYRAADDGERVDFVFQTEKWKGEPSNKEPDKCSRILWVKTDEMPKGVIEFITEILLTDSNHFEFGYSLKWI